MNPARSVKGYGSLLLRLSIAFAGAVLSGIYGIFHNVIVYPISWEYFDEMNLHYSHFDFGFSGRALAAEMGFLGTWWVGFFAAWLLARIAVSAWPPKEAFLRSLFGLGIVSAIAALGAIAGNHYSLTNPISQDWSEYFQSIVIQDTEAFVRVATIHREAYRGALFGTIVAVVVLLSQTRHREKETDIS